VANDGTAPDVRSLSIARATLARVHGLADFAFAMQGLGSGAISLHGTPEQRSRYLTRVAAGEAISAFALSEPDAGSDVAAMACAARADGDHYVLDGEKTWISNGGIADFYVVFARSGEAPGARGISAFIVEAGTPGFHIAERIDVMAPHPLARLRFEACRVPASQRLGAPGEGFKLAMRTLDVFRTSVAAAALGFARRALAEALQRATTRTLFGGVLADLQLTQSKLALMATTIDSAALLTYRAAWQRDQGRGVVSGEPVERLYREIRSLRIYEGATEVQQLIIARELLKENEGNMP
jgi:acyl-CoA dehydrogenase